MFGYRIFCAASLLHVLSAAGGQQPKPGYASRKAAAQAAAAENTPPEVQPHLVRSLQWWDNTLSKQPSADGLRERCGLLGMINDVQAELDCWKLGLQHHAAELDNARALWAVPDTHNAIAMCHRRLGQHKLAAQAFIAALGHEPRRPDLLLQLGLTQHISGGSVAAARRKFQEALDMAAEPQEAPALLVALATADIRLGDLGAAADSYHRATGDVTVGNPVQWHGAGRPGFADRLGLLGGGWMLPPGVALRGIDDAAHPSASGLLTESGELSMPTLSEGQWYWLQLHKNAAVEKWRARQHPERCDSAKVLVIELSAMTHGLGSQIHLLSLAASYAEEDSRTLLVLPEDEWWFTDASDCPSRSWSCHFKSLSSCAADGDDLGENYDPATAVRLGSIEHRRLRRDAASYHAEDRLRILHAGYDELRQELDVSAHRNRRPRAWAEQGIPLIWWRSVLVSELMKPKREVIDGAVALAGEAGWTLGHHFDEANEEDSVPVIGLHVRRGDKVVEAAPPRWKDYVRGAEQCALKIADAAHAKGHPIMSSVLVCLLYSTSHAKRGSMYVSSDSATAAGEAEWQAQQGQWQVHYEPTGVNITLRAAAATERKLLDGVADSSVVQSHQLNVTEYARQAIRAAWLLSESDCLVTTFSSNMGRLAYELMLAKRPQQARVLSLDSLWYTQP